MSGTIFGIFLFLLVFTPLAFGTVERWSLSVMESLSFSALLLFIVGKWRKGATSLYEVPGLLPLSLFLGYILLQLVPVPPDLLKIASPGTYALYKETLWNADPSAWGSISIHKKATLSEFFRFCSYAAFYVLTVQLLTEKELLKKTVWTVVVFASALAFFGLLQQLLWNNKLYWVRELTAGGKPFGPYVNRNHYAGLIDMLLPLVVSLFIYYRPRHLSTSLRERTVEVFSSSRTNLHVLLGLSGVLLATSVFLSLSKGGIISLCLSLVFMAGMIKNIDRQARGWVFVVLTLMFVFYSIGWFGLDRIFERFAALRDTQGSISEVRVGIWRDSLGILKDFPLTGTGPGSYLRIYQKYRSVTAGGIVDHAHNDYLEGFAEGGALSVALFGWFFAAALYKAYNGFRRRRDRYSIFLFIGAVSGLVSMLVHSLTDFNLHIGANGLYFFFLIGLAVSAAHTRMHDGLNDTFLGQARPFLMKRLLVSSAAVFIVGTVFIMGVLAAWLSLLPFAGLNEGRQATKEELPALRNALDRASFFDPTEGGHSYASAGVKWSLGDKGAAVGQYRKAARLDPVNGEYLQALGLHLPESAGGAGTERLLQSGITCDRMNPSMYKRYALWLISKGEREKASENLRSALTLEPAKTREYIALLVLYGWTDSQIRGVLPALVGPHLIFADYLDKTQHQDMADEEYRSAIDYVKYEKEPHASSFYQSRRYFMKRGMYDEALAVMRKAAETLPNNADIRMALAETYEKAGIPYRAAEEYRKALVLDPGNRTARERLEIK
jgi:O-antigen ligase/tetratricopeptide (TPR) repeat protein